jgi:hypothetical protein
MKQEMKRLVQKEFSIADILQHAVLGFVNFV